MIVGTGCGKKERFITKNSGPPKLLRWFQALRLDQVLPSTTCFERSKTEQLIIQTTDDQDTHQQVISDSEAIQLNKDLMKILLVVEQTLGLFFG